MNCFYWLSQQTQVQFVVLIFLRYSITRQNFAWKWSANSDILISLVVYTLGLFIKTTVFPQIVSAFPRKLFFFEFLKLWKSHIVSALSFLLCDVNLNSLLTRVRKLFKSGNYSREETVCGNMVTGENAVEWK